jgi:hypothetical protein
MFKINVKAITVKNQVEKFENFVQTNMSYILHTNMFSARYRLEQKLQFVSSPNSLNISLSHEILLQFDIST